MNTNSNTYTIAYSAILVVTVAFLLAFVSQSLKGRQEENVKLDLKKQILYSLNIRGLDNAEAEEKYNEVVKSKKQIDGQSIYFCEVDGAPKYVFPLKGMGLWGGISGFLAVNEDKATVYGVFFNHESETAGLGAEIKDSQAWQEKFIGKKLFKENSEEVALSIVKKIEDPQSQVDVVTGATLTSDGVRDMLRDGIKQNIKFLKEK